MKPDQLQHKSGCSTSILSRGMARECAKLSAKFKEPSREIAVLSGTMGRGRKVNMNPIGNLERILESVVIWWADLTCGAPSGLIQIEYGFADGGTLGYLKVWSCLSHGHGEW